MKFGGTSIADAQAVLRVVGILEQSMQKGDEVVAVISALPTVTDKLYSITETAREGNMDMIEAFVGENLDLHCKVAKGCIRNPDILGRVLNELTEISEELRSILRSIARLKELTPRSRDFLLAFGESFSTPIVSGASEDSGLMTEWLSGGEAGITTDENFGDANPLMEVTAHQVRARLESLLKEGKLPIVAGYGACSPHGVATTLGRGGSDYTATLIGAALDADEIVLWKEVGGLMTADPKIEPNAKVLKTISYAEASEMAYFGAKAIHPRALEPVAERQIPVRVRSSLDPAGEGTLIVGDSFVRSKSIVKAVTLVDKVGMITVTGAGMSGQAGVAAKVFRVLGDASVNILMISQSSSEAGISLVVSRERLPTATNALELGILGGTFVKNVTSESDVCVIAAVGAGMKGSPGVAARVFKAVADRGVNIRMIAQGSSELNISFVVTEKDGPKVIRALHEEFELSKF
jgi:aspartate kinase